MPKQQQRYSTLNPFGPAQRKLNKELCQEMKVKTTKLFTHYDLRDVYDKFNGACSICGVQLQARSTQYGNNTRSAQFRLRVALNRGGKLHRDNLLLVCALHRKDKPRKSYPTKKVFGYNTFADHIAQLVYAIVVGDEDNALYFKRNVNIMLEEFVQTLEKGSDVPDVDPVPRYEFDNSVADLIEDLATAFKEIKKTDDYTVLRRNT